MKPWLMALAFARGRRLVTQTFTSLDAAAAIPAGVTVLEEVRGRGSDGEPSTYAKENITLASVSKRSTQSGGSSLTQQAVFDHGILESVQFFSSSNARTVNFVRKTFTVGPDNLVQSTTSSRSERVRGDPVTSVLGGSGSAPITYSDADATVYVRIDVRQFGTPGTAATGFGKTFPGGSDGPASYTTFTKVSVIPGQSYPLDIPAGGSITISYYQ